MVFNQAMYIYLLILLLVANLCTAVPQPRPDCQTTCGDLTNITFPFGTTPECYLDDNFFINCTTTTNGGYTAFLQRNNTPVLNITLDGLMRVSVPMVRMCYNDSSDLTNDAYMNLSSFSISSTMNWFTLVSCDTLAIALGPSMGSYVMTGCAAMCNSTASVINGSCLGIGCCRASIPEQAGDFIINVGYMNMSSNSTRVQSFNPCSYAFIVEKQYYEFSSGDLMYMQGQTNMPVVLDWAVGNLTCNEAKTNQSSYACRDANSECINSINRDGYNCNCTQGFEGNPYLTNGCQGVSLGLLLLLVVTTWMFWLLHKRKLIKQREQFFDQNGGFVLQQQLSKHQGSSQLARIFTAEDLKNATNNYDEARVIGQGGFGTVYKGILSGNLEVAIKKSKITDKSQVEQFINEVVILSQINHRNVVKLLGCCLETEVPLLVYEFIKNGTLSDHIHDKIRALSLSWEMRLRIAVEAAGALAYLHSETSTPIVHRDIKSTNILLDENYITKVSDFGASRLVPLDQSQLATLVQGTFGYMDPEYFHSSQLTEKSDVYSFGVLLAELMTGETAISFNREEKDRNLAMYFVSSVKEDRLHEILDDRLMKEGNIDHLKGVAMVVKMCLRVKGEERPTMREVSIELEGLLSTITKHPWVEKRLDIEESEYLLNEIVHSDGYDASGTTGGYDSMKGQMIMPSELIR